MSPLGKELKEFEFFLQKHKFRIDSTEDVPFSILLEGSNSGFLFEKSGNHLFSTDRTSTEVVGIKIAPNSDIPAKMIRAVNGDIVLDALQGDIVLRGMNIRIEGVDGLGGEVTINSSKIVQIGAPIVRSQSEQFTATGTVSASIAGGSAETFGEFSNESSIGTDFLQSSFFGKIFSAIKRFKKFFESVCG